MMQKQKKIRLTGKAFQSFVGAVRQRDSCNCVLCGSYVSSEYPVHHEPGGPYKQDIVSQAVTLCHTCHVAVHGRDGHELRMRLREYLRGGGSYGVG